MPDFSRGPHPSTWLDSLDNKTGTWRAFRPQYVQLSSPCREECPAGEDIPRWIDLLRARSFRDAWAILTEDNPFPAIMGRVCTHPCETGCNRAHHDEALGISSMEQFLGDRAVAEGWNFTPAAAARSQRVAVVGGGPAGLSCAFQLRRLGYQVVIYEAGHKLGGNLHYAYPEYLLPAAVVAAEVERIIGMGIEVRLGVKVGTDLSWAELRGAHDAVFLATGAPLIASPGVPGENLAGVLDGMAFLQRVKAGERDFAGQKAVVIGAGFTGMESARTLRRLGFEVTIATAEDRGGLTVPERMGEARAEGVQLVDGAEVIALEGDGKVQSVKLRTAAYPALILSADLVILATGRMPDLESLPEDGEVDERFNLSADTFTARTAMAAIFAGGDVSGTRLAVEAVGAGKRGAAAIHAYLQGEDEEAALGRARIGYGANLSMRYYTRPESYHENLKVDLRRVVTYDDIETIYFDHAARINRSQLDPSGRLGSFAEVKVGLSEDQALAESQRCFSCGTCIGCENCLVFCPDMAITRRDDGLGFNINWDYCKGCGACVNECPREALVLEEEVK